MKAGRELDALVAEKVMKWKRKSFPMFGKSVLLDENGSVTYFNPSTERDGEFMLVMKMKADGWKCSISKIGDEWGVSFGRKVGYDASRGCRAETLPLATSLAALKAIGKG